MAGVAFVPEDIIIHHILIRLPVKSLARFRCACKSWNSLLYNPDYLSHLTRSISQNPPHDDRDDDHLILMNNYIDTGTTGLSILSRKKFSETFIIDKYVPYPLCLSKDDYIYLVGSVNGLVCMAFYFDGDHQFVLWNPTIRFSKTVVFPKHFEFFLNNHNTLMYGFGWDSVTNDYKLIYGCFRNFSSSFFVYSSNTNSWGYNNSVTPDIYCCCPEPCVIVNGCPYWRKWTPRSILKFDTRDNNFTLLDIPSKAFSYRLINLEDCLALIDFTTANWCAPRVYCMNEQNMWIHKYTINDAHVNQLRMTCFKYGGEIVHHGKKKLYLYDPKSRKTKHRPCCCPIKSRKRKHGGSHDCRGYPFKGFSYTPSVVALPGMKALHL